MKLWAFSPLLAFPKYSPPSGPTFHIKYPGINAEGDPFPKKSRRVQGRTKRKAAHTGLFP